MMCRLCLQNIFHQQILLPDDVARQIAEYLVIQKNIIATKELKDKKKKAAKNKALNNKFGFLWL